MKYYYLLNGKIMSANEKMPQGEDYVSLNPTHFNKLDFDIDAKQWLNSLQPCEISESELEKIKLNVGLESYNTPIEVTDIVEEKSIRELENKYKNQSSGTVGFAADYVYKDYIFFRQPKQVEEIEVVDALLNTFGQYCTLKGIKLTDSNKVGQAVIDFKKSDIYEIFKNQK